MHPWLAVHSMIAVVLAISAKPNAMSLGVVPSSASGLCVCRCCVASAMSRSVSARAMHTVTTSMSGAHMLVWNRVEGEDELGIGEILVVLEDPPRNSDQGSSRLLNNNNIHRHSTNCHTQRTTLGLTHSDICVPYRFID